MARVLNELILADLIAARAETRPDLDVVTFERGETGADEVRTYADLWRNGNRLAAGLLARGMTYGDRFAILMRNHPEFIELMIAASLTGLVFVPIDPRTRGDKLAFTLNNSGCRGVVCADYALDQVAAVRGQVPSVDWIWVLESRDEPDALTTAAVPGAVALGAVIALALLCANGFTSLWCFYAALVSGAIALHLRRESPPESNAARTASPASAS